MAGKNGAANASGNAQDVSGLTSGSSRPPRLRRDGGLTRRYVSSTKMEMTHVLHS